MYGELSAQMGPHDHVYTYSPGRPLLHAGVNHFSLANTVFNGEADQDRDADHDARSLFLRPFYLP